MFRVNCASFSPDGTRIVTGGLDKSARVWDARTGARALLELNGHTGTGVTSVAFSPDGTQIGSGSIDRTMKLWDSHAGTLLSELKAHTNTVTSLSFSPDGTRIVTGSWDQTAKVWDVRTGTPLLDLKGHTKRIDTVSFSPDGKKIVTGSFDKSCPRCGAWPEEHAPDRAERAHRPRTLRVVQPRWFADRHRQ